MHPTTLLFYLLPLFAGLPVVAQQCDAVGQSTAGSCLNLNPSTTPIDEDSAGDPPKDGLLQGRAVEGSEQLERRGIDGQPTTTLADTPSGIGPHSPGTLSSRPAFFRSFSKFLPKNRAQEARKRAIKRRPKDLHDVYKQTYRDWVKRDKHATSRMRWPPTHPAGLCLPEPSTRKRRGICGHPAIAPALYVKAHTHQDQLTLKERSLLLSHGDLVGKALGHPDSLTTDEIHQLLLMPPPDVVRANIQRATGGSLTTVDELYAKAQHASSLGELDTLLNKGESDLIFLNFHAPEDFESPEESRTAFKKAHAAYQKAATAAWFVPGAQLAMNLVDTRLGWGSFAPAARPSPWPPTVAGRDSERFYGQDAHISPWDLATEWLALPEATKEAYHIRSEKYRIEAWIRFETALADGTSFIGLFTSEERGPPLYDSGHAIGTAWYDSMIPGASYVATGFKLFGDELLADPKAKMPTGRDIFAEVMKRWEVLPDSRVDAYEETAAEANAAVRAVYWARAAEAISAAEAAYEDGRAFYP